MAHGESGGRRANRLAGESSPYLLQHAHNPVDWWPWGEAAFAEARRRGVPIFLSVGYSTCYWCHVMERESFEHGPTAELMNELFVNVKVDREERPAVDDVYMAATQIVTGRGGWPMSVWLEPEGLRPFWAGTYFPREPRHGLPSFGQMLRGMSSAWGEKRGEVLEQAGRIAASVGEHLAAPGEPVALGPERVSAAVSALLQQEDRTRGGFGGGPKFPQPVYLDLLLDARASAGDEATRAAVDGVARRALDAMAAGGLFDHLGGGFHRYCVDATWTVPHFEKMLYDNAQLALVYARAAAAYGDAFYAGVVRRTLEYVRREMTGEGGGFFSAQDAEVDGREGLDYLWTRAGVEAVLEGDDAAFAVGVFGLAEPNFTDPHHPEDGPKSVPRLEDRPDRVAAALGEEPGAFAERLERVSAALLAVRDGRERAATDDKVLVSWNGMMIRAMVAGAALLDEPRYLEAAERAAVFVLGEMADGSGGLGRSWRGGRLAGDAGLEDYAAMVSALVALHRAGAGGGLDERAAGLTSAAIERFGDGRGGFYDTEAGRGDLFVRPRTTYDGAVPSGGSMMLHALVDLAELRPGDGWDGRAVAGLRAVSSEVAERSVAAANSTRALLRVLTSRAAWRGASSSALAEGPTVAERENAGPDRLAVEIHADAERVAVAAGSPGVLNLRLVVRPGFHVLAADHVPDSGRETAAARGLVPLRVGLVSGSGVAVYCDYPEGEPYAAAFLEAGSDAGSGGDAGAELLVHAGEVDLRVVLEKAEGVGVGPGEPVLGVTYQACSDTECLMPRTAELDVAIDAG